MFFLHAGAEHAASASRASACFPSHPPTDRFRKGPTRERHGFPPSAPTAPTAYANHRGTTADICIVGAGSSGITVAKALKQQGLAFDCFEKGSDIGGMYGATRMITACRPAMPRCISIPAGPISAIRDFPIDPDMPDFLSHAQFLRHLEAYADHFGIRPLVSFNREVEAIEPVEGRWRVRLADRQEREYGHVIVANGHLWDPRMPDFAGDFAGTAAAFP